MQIDFRYLEHKRFLFVVNTLNVFGGAERQALILASYIKENISGNVAFLAFEDGECFRRLLEDAEIKVYFFPFKHNAAKSKKILRYYQLLQYLKPLKPDILIPYVAESNKIVAQIWRYTRAKFAFRNQREEGRKLYGTPLEKKLIINVSAIVSNFFEGKNALIRNYGLKDEDISVINNRIIPFKEEFEKKDWHQEFGIEKNRPLVSMIANITNRKDHETLLKAWSMVILECKAKKIELPFLVLAERQAETYDRLRILAFDLNLSDHVVFIGELHKDIVLVKLDAEGAEVDILNKLIYSKSIRKIKKLLVETHEKQMPDLFKPTQELKRKIRELDLKNINLNWV